MKLLHIIAGMDPMKGGVSQAVRTMITGLNALGIHNEVASSDTADATFFGKDKFPVHPLGPASTPWVYTRELMPWLVKNICAFDFVIIHGLWLYQGYAVRKVLRQLNNKQHVSESRNCNFPRLFVMPHGMLDPYFQQATGRRLKALRNWAYWKLIERRVVNEADGVLYTSEEEKQLAQKPFKPFCPKQETVVSLGVENPPLYTVLMREAFLQKCSGLYDNPYILFISRIHPKKGADLLINAYGILLENARKVLSSENLESGTTSVAVPHLELPKLVIAGPGLDTPYGQKLQKLVSDSEQMKSSIFFAGMLTGDAKWGAFYGCDAFVLPSHQENFGISVVEAMACGKPVLISNKINIWQEINETGSGIVSHDTADGTVEMLQRWQDLPSREKQQMGVNARRTFENNFAVLAASMRLLNALRA